MSTFVIFAVCAFCSGFALRLADPLVLPVAHHFAVSPASAALLGSAYALPYALAQPFLGALGDRYSKARCIQVCVTGLAAMLLAGALAPRFDWLIGSRMLAGMFAGGLIPLVLASLGDRYAMHERQVMIGRMLFAIIAGQMLGSLVSGAVNVWLGWRSALLLAAGLALAAAGLAWLRMPPAPAAPRDPSQPSFLQRYARVFDNPKAVWLYGVVIAEGVMFFGLFPFVGQMLVERTGTRAEAVSVEAGLVLGAFGIGGLGYAFAVRRLLKVLGVARMCWIGALASALCFAALALFEVWWADALAMMVAGFGFYMVHNSLQTEATEIAPSARASAVALFAAGLFIGQAVGPLVFGALLQGLGFRPLLLALGAGLVLLGHTVVRQVVGRRPTG